MKKLLLFTCLLLCSIKLVEAQTAIAYDYDLDGNRSGRRVANIYDKAPAFKGDPSQAVEQDNIGTQTVAIYPNPTKGIFSIGVTGLDSETENYYMLYNMQGKLMKRQRITSDRTSVDISWDAAGMYLLDVSLGGNVSRWKIVKQ